MMVYDDIAQIIVSIVKIDTIRKDLKKIERQDFLSCMPHNNARRISNAVKHLELAMKDLEKIRIDLCGKKGEKNER